MDLLIGGQAIDSAQFAVLGLAADTPVATLAAGNDNGISLDATNFYIQIS